MPHIPDIPLAAITCFDSWMEAPEGAVLQMNFEEKLVVVMCGKMMAQGSPSNCLVVLEGADAGTVLDGETVGLACAIDITDLVILNVRHPAPTVVKNVTETPGLLFLTETNEIYMSAKSLGGRWVACIQGQNPGQVKHGTAGIKTRLGSLSVLDKNARYGQEAG